MDKRWGIEEVAKMIEGDDIPDTVDQAILAVGPGATFRAFVEALRSVRTGIYQSF